MYIYIVIHRQIYFVLSEPISVVAQLPGAVEYTDCTSAEG